MFGLKDDEVHLWRADLDLPQRCIGELKHSLSSDERSRAERFVFDEHRNRFIAGRGLLRHLLSRYAGLEPGRLEFSYGPWGKPALASGGVEETLCFNVSHSHDVALYAVARNRAVGIDIERIHPERDVEALATSVFLPGECALIRSLPPAQKVEAFFKGWTIKEAYVKATGRGLAAMEQVEVTLSPGAPAALVAVNGDAQAAARWSLCEIEPFRDYVGALVVEGQGWRLNQFTL